MIFLSREKKGDDENEYCVLAWSKVHIPLEFNLIYFFTFMKRISSIKKSYL